MDHFFINRNKEMRKQQELSSTKSLLALKQLQPWHLDPDQLAIRNISGQAIPPKYFHWPNVNCIKKCIAISRSSVRI